MMLLLINFNRFKMLAGFLVLFCMFSSIDAVKELVPQGSENNDAKLILDLIKRLGEPSYQSEEDRARVGSRQDSSRSDLVNNNKHIQSETASNELHNLQTACQPVIEDGSIIKTTESINAGAKYIDSVKNVKSNADCLEYCCQNASCDVAVYQDKADRFCYLFRCAGQCIFKPHSGYFVSTIKARKSPEHPEEDLQSLNTEVVGSSEKKTADAVAQNTPVKQKAELPVEETTVTTAATTQTETPELFITQHSVGLGGFCTQDRHCEDPNAVCGHGNCICKHAYYNKEGMCRKVCLSSEFECFELGTLSRGPECIDHSQVCDSYLNCADGSDEFNCESIDLSPGMRPPKQSSLQKLQDKSPQSLPVALKNMNGISNTGGESTQATKSASQASRLSIVTTAGSAKTDSPAPTSSPTLKPFPSSHTDKKHIYLSSEKVIIANTSDAEGPIIALSLGLAFTMILLVLVGCRLKNVRHRLRKGRPLHQNEADYLINGMYL